MELNRITQMAKLIQIYINSMKILSETTNQVGSLIKNFSTSKYTELNLLGHPIRPLPGYLLVTYCCQAFACIQTNLHSTVYLED